MIQFVRQPQAVEPAAEIRARRAYFYGYFFHDLLTLRDPVPIPSRRELFVIGYLLQVERQRIAALQRANGDAVPHKRRARKSFYRVRARDIDCVRQVRRA